MREEYRKYQGQYSRPVGRLLVAVGVLGATLAAGARAEAPKVLEEFSGPTQSVVDGDILKMTRDGKTLIIRLEGIDAPELAQPFGPQTKDALAKLVTDKTITVKKTGADNFGKIIGVVLVDGVDVNAKMIADGMAWHFKRYNSDERLAKLEEEAVAAKRGLWSQEDPLPPWEYRANKKPPAPPQKGQKQ